MTKSVRDYFARRLGDPAYAAAYRESEGEYQAERARILARLEGKALAQAMKEVEKYFSARPDLLRALDLLQQMQQQHALLNLVLPAWQPGCASAGYQVSGEARYDADFISTQVSYNAHLL